VGGGGKLVGVVAEAEFDVAEELPVGGVDEGLGHLAAGRVGGGPQLVHQGTDAAFAVFGGRGRGWIVGVQHGCCLAVQAEGR
jgi:hypothetical protein